jgi:hypothetical protein
MKPKIAAAAAGLLLLIGIIFHLASPMFAQAAEKAERSEYVTIRWAGRDNTHLIRPNGQVEILGPQLVKIKKPERVDERSFYMNIAMNALAKEGYELAAMTPDDYVMKRQAAR